MIKICCEEMLTKFIEGNVDYAKMDYCKHPVRINVYFKNDSYNNNFKICPYCKSEKIIEFCD